MRDNTEHLFVGACAIHFGSDYHAEAVPSREWRDYCTSDPNPPAQALRHPVTKGRQGVRRYEEANSRVQFFGPSMSTKSARMVASGRAPIVRFSILWMR